MALIPTHNFWKGFRSFLLRKIPHDIFETVQTSHELQGFCQLILKLRCDMWLETLR